MRKSSELVIEIHEDGRRFIEISSCVKWFRDHLAGPGATDIEQVIGNGAAYALEGMLKKGMTNPTRVTDENGNELDPRILEPQ